MRPLRLLLCLPLTACVGGFPPPRVEPRPIFDPIAFFSGESEGRGRIRILFRSGGDLAVHSVGRIGPDGGLVLDQRIERPGHSPKRRQWHIGRLARGRYVAALSDADGPVRIGVTGNLLRLDFRQDGLSVHQDISLAADGRSALNHMTLSKFGLRVAAVEERIDKKSPD